MVSPEMMTVKIRIPHWSKENILTINNEPVSEIIPGNYTEIKRNWSAKDKISLQPDMRARLVMTETDKFHAAIQRGPIVLVRDTRLPDTDLGITMTPVLNAAGYIELSPADTGTDNIWMSYSASFLPESYSEIPAGPVSVYLCDYASAGNGKERSTYAVWMPQLFDAQKH